MSNALLTEESKQAPTISRGMIGLLAAAFVVAAAVSTSWLLGHRGLMTGSLATAWPFVVLLVSLGLIITLITIVRVHPFIALVVAAIAAGLMAQPGILPPVAPGKEFHSHWIRAVELTMAGLGSTAANIAIVIGLASVIGMCLLESGAADKIVRRFLAIFGEKHAGLALLLSTYIVSIPIFFDTIFMLLLPLALALRMRTGKDYLLYILAICCAGATTHSTIIPHPGPAAIAGELKVDAGLSIFVGLLVGLIPMGCGWVFCHWVNRRIDVSPALARGNNTEELQAIIDKPERDLPSMTASLLPILLPVGLIWIGSFAVPFGKPPASPLRAFAEFIGHRNIALLIGMVIALWVLVRQRGISLSRVGDLIGPPLETAGMIILITAAGGAFGAMLKNAGVGTAIKTAVAGYQINFILLAWIVTVVIRVAQGSATVAMLTASSMLASLIGDNLPYHPVYIFLAIGYGAMAVSWMNDSGFWVIAKLSGLTEKQTLRSWTILVTVISVTGLLATLLLSILFPFKPT